MSYMGSVYKKAMKNAPNIYRRPTKIKKPPEHVRREVSHYSSEMFGSS